MDELNGFTGFSRKKPGFVSAKDAMADHEYRAAREKMMQSPEAARRHEAALRERQAQAMRRTLESEKFGPAAKIPLSPVLDFITRDENDGAFFDQEKLKTIAPTDRHWAWREIDLGAIRHNVSEIRRRLRNGTHLMAVVKADAYGHGAVEVAKTALNSGADYLGVATIEEAIELREAYVNGPILVLSQPPESAIPLLLGYNIMPAIFTPDFAIAYGEAADALDRKAPYHLKINTGMNRIGVRHDEVLDFLHQTSFHRALDLVGTFTHFATADCEGTLDFQIQEKRFIEALKEMHAAGFDPGIIHAANSAAIIRYPNTHFDMVRLGISLYGYYPCPETIPMIDLRPAMSVYARISDAKLVPMSEGVSYGMNYRSTGSVKICTIPLGYADGLRRGLSGKVQFLIDGVPVRQVGNICMDQTMFEVNLRSSASRTRIDPQIGDKVVIVGQQNGAQATVEDMCRILDTIPHEITIGFSQRMPRVFV